MNINIFCHIYQYQLINSCLIDPNTVGHYVIWRDEYIGGNLEGNDKIISEETLSVGENIGDIIWVVVGDREYNRLQEVGISQSDIKKLVDIFERGHMDWTDVFDKMGIESFKTIYGIGRDSKKVNGLGC